MEGFLEKVYFNNTIQEYLIALALIVGGIMIIRIFRRGVLSRLKKWASKTETSFDDYLVDGIERFGLPLFNYLIIYAGLNYLVLSARADKLLKASIDVVVTYYLIRLVIFVLKLLLESHVKKQDHGAEKIKQLRGVTAVISFLIWSLGTVFLFDNLGYDVTAVITGLGIGGIAIALAAQNILGDLFNYFVIFFDRPFEIGDYIEFDNKKGTVEYIGIKTTRLKSIGGEQLILPNSDLTKSRVHNFKRMTRRRILFTVTISADTPTNKVKDVQRIIKDIINSREGITYERVHLMYYSDFGLTFEIVYFVENAEYNVYADIQHYLNIAILEQFQQQGILMASPPFNYVLSNKK